MGKKKKEKDGAFWGKTFLCHVLSRSVNLPERGEKKSEVSGKEVGKEETFTQRTDS